MTCVNEPFYEWCHPLTMNCVQCLGDNKILSSSPYLIKLLGVTLRREGDLASISNLMESDFLFDANILVITKPYLIKESPLIAHAISEMDLIFLSVWPASDSENNRPISQ
jgi:hypothetical protein